MGFNMKRRAFLKSGAVFTGLIWVPKSFAQRGLRSPAVVGSLKPTAAAGGGASYLLNQNFETPTTGYDNGETWTPFGTNVLPAYGTGALKGSQSFRVHTTS